MSRCLLGIVIGLVSLGSLARAADQPPQVADVAPDFSLQTLDGRQAKLSDLTKRGPVVLVVLRGYPGYQCPACSMQAGDFLSKAKSLAAAKAQVVLVYPGPSKELKERAGEFLGDKGLPEHFHFALDPDYTFTNQYCLRWDAENETAYPATFVIDSEGKIRFANISRTHKGRTQAAEVLKVLRAKAR